MSKPSRTPPSRVSKQPLTKILRTRAFLPGGLYTPELRAPIETVSERLVLGQALRQFCPRESHAEWAPALNRADPLSLIQASNRGRVPDLVPLRMGRMAASPFAFLRGAACVMASDLATLPDTGLQVVIDGDAHIDNFGLFGTPEGRVVFDLNDFDETVVGPWIWDLKRLVASLNVAARENGLSRRERHAAVLVAVEGYRKAISAMAGMTALGLWQAHTLADQMAQEFKGDHKVKTLIRKAEEKALAQNNVSLFNKVIEKGPRDSLRFKSDPPLLVRADDETREALVEALTGYSKTLPPERAYMLRRYRVVDAAHRVVGVGSVGCRAWLVLLMGNNPDDPLFLQVKEAVKPAAAAFLPEPPRDFRHQGRRVAHGQRLLQAEGDPLVGWTTLGGKPYYVRQMRNLKGAIPNECMAPGPLNFFGGAFATLLARGHARTGDACVIAGYCGNSHALDEALAEWAEHYGDQVEQDHALLVKAIKSQKIQAEPKL